MHAAIATMEFKQHHLPLHCHGPSVRTNTVQSSNSWAMWLNFSSPIFAKLSWAILPCWNKANCSEMQNTPLLHAAVFQVRWAFPPFLLSKLLSDSSVTSNHIPAVPWQHFPSISHFYSLWYSKSFLVDITSHIDNLLTLRRKEKKKKNKRIYNIPMTLFEARFKSLKEVYV